MSATLGLLLMRKAWTPSHDEYLLELLIEQQNCGKTAYNLFKFEVFKTVTHKLNSKFGTSFKESQIKLNYNAMKKDYGVVKTLLASPGFRWDVKKRMVVADDKVWDNYTSVRSDAKPIRWKTLPPFDQLSIVFEEPGAKPQVYKVVDEGNSDTETVQSSEPSKRPTQVNDNALDYDSTFYVNDSQTKKRKSFPPAPVEVEDSIENAFYEIPSSPMLKGVENVKDTLPRKRKSIALETSGKQIVQVEAEDNMENELYEFPSAPKFKEVGKNVKDDRALYQKCLEELQRIEELNDSEFTRSVNALKDDKNAIAFMTIKGPRRLIWLRSLFDGY